MKDSKFAKFWPAAMAVLVVVCVALTILSALARQGMVAANHDRQEVESVIYEFIRTNAGLTRFARVHVVTGNPLQYNLYRDYEVLFAANKDRMIALGLSEEEAYPFQALIDHTVVLAQFESEAFTLRAAGHHQAAIDMLFGREYEAIGIQSRDALASFEHLVMDRVLGHLLQAESEMAIFRMLAIVIGGVLVALALVGMVVFLLKKHPARVPACLTVVLSCVFVVLSVFLQAAENKAYYTNERSMSFEATTHEFRRATLDTIRYSRDYIINGDPASYYAYFDAIAHVYYLTEQFRGYALSDEAMMLLDSISEDTDAIVAIELAALEMKNTNIDEAIAIIHSPEHAAIGLPRANMIILFATMVRFLIAGELSGYLAQIVFYQWLVVLASVGKLALLALTVALAVRRKSGDLSCAGN